MNIPTVAELKIMGIQGGAAVRARLCALLHVEGIATGTEVQLETNNVRSRSGRFRTDIAVFGSDAQTPIIVIETKRYSGPLFGHRQRENYARCGIPAISVGPQTLVEACRAIVRFVAGDSTALAPFLIREPPESDALVDGGKGAHVQESSTDLPGNDSKSDRDSIPVERSETGTTRTTWLTPYYEAFRSAYGEAPTPLAVKRMARAFKELEVATPRPELVRRFGNYLRSTPGRFYSVEHFGDTLPTWKDAAPQSRLDPRPGESTDDYIARVGR